MTLSRKGKAIYLVLAVFVIFLPVFNEPQMYNNNENTHENCGHDHNHAGNKNDHDKNCPVCLKIELSKNAASNIKFFNIAVCSLIPFLQYTDTVNKYSELIAIGLSPIKLKVRFNT